MSAPFPPFSRPASCPKCGHAAIQARHVPATLSAEQRATLTALGQRDTVAADVEHMLRTCATCLFSWCERPLDAGGAS